MLRYFKKVEPLLHRYFYTMILLSFAIFVFLEFQDMSNAVTYFVISPIFALVVCSLFFTREKKPLEELLSFFLFPLFFSSFLQPLTYLITTDSTTSIVLQMLLMVPISNVVYAIVLVRRNQMSLKTLGHLVTTIQAVLFVSTIIGFLIKNPLLFDGFFINTKMADFGLVDVPSLKNLALANVIEGFTQTFSIPYLFSATAIKGWVEYQNFKENYR